MVPPAPLAGKGYKAYHFRGRSRSAPPAFRLTSRRLSIAPFPDR